MKKRGRRSSLLEELSAGLDGAYWSLSPRTTPATAPQPQQKKEEEEAAAAKEKKVKEEGETAATEGEEEAAATLEVEKEGNAAAKAPEKPQQQQQQQQQQQKQKKKRRREMLGLDGAYWNSALAFDRQSAVVAAKKQERGSSVGAASASSRSSSSSRQPAKPIPKHRLPLHFKQPSSSSTAAEPAEPKEEKELPPQPKRAVAGAGAGIVAATEEEEEEEKEETTTGVGSGVGLDGSYWALDNSTGARRRSAPVDPYVVAASIDAARAKERAQRRPPRPHAEFSVLRRLQMQEARRRWRLTHPRMDPAEKARLQREAKEQAQLEVLERLRREARGVEIAPGLFLGSRHSARNLEWLREARVHYIVNAAPECRNSFGSAEQPRVAVAVAAAEDEEEEEEEDSGYGVALGSESPETAAAATTVVAAEEDALGDVGFGFSEDSVAAEVAAEQALGCAEFEYKRINVRDSEHHERRFASLLDGAIAHISNRLERGDGGVLIHCKEGRSRGPTLAIAFLVCARGMTLAKAFSHVSALRGGLRLNTAFERLLSDLELRVTGVSTLDFLGNRRSSSSSLSAVSSSSPASTATPPPPSTASTTPLPSASSPSSGLLVSQTPMQSETGTSSQTAAVIALESQ